MTVMNRLIKGHSLINIANWAVTGLLLAAFLFLGRDIVSFYGKQKKRSPEGERSRQPVKWLGFKDYDAVLQQNPFGFSSQALRSLYGESAKKAAPVVMPTVRGTIAGSGRFGYAVFVDKNGNQEVFRIGENVFGAGILKRVEKDKVLIATGGGTIEIPFTDLSAMEKPGGNPAGGVGSMGRQEGSGYTINKENLQASLDNPKQIMTDARFLPNVVDGAQQGFILREVRPGGIYQNLGLLNNDVVLRINEFNISNPETALQALNALRGMERINLDIIRDGRKMTLNFLIK